jgi:hypothetical protein
MEEAIYNRHDVPDDTLTYAFQGRIAAVFVTFEPRYPRQRRLIPVAASAVFGLCVMILGRFLMWLDRKKRTTK